MSSCKVNFEQILYPYPHKIPRESHCLVKLVFMKDKVIMLINKLVSIEVQVVMLG